MPTQTLRIATCSLALVFSGGLLVGCNTAPRQTSDNGQTARFALHDGSLGAADPLGSAVVIRRTALRDRAASPRPVPNAAKQNGTTATSAMEPDQPE